MTIALAASGSSGRGELMVAEVEVLGHFLLEDLLQYSLDAFPDPGLHVPFHGVFKLLLRGRAPTASFNSQTTRRYPKNRR